MTTFEKSIVLVTRGKITSSNPRFNYYGIRCNADEPGLPETLENSVSFNRYGTLVTTQKLRFNSAYILTAEQAEIIKRLKKQYDGEDVEEILKAA